MNRATIFSSGHRNSRGFVLPSAIFLLVILAGLAAFLVNISMTQSMTSAQDIQGARAYQAARAGIEWGLYRVLDPANATVVLPENPPGVPNPAWPNMPPCAAGALVIDGFTVNVACASSPAGAAGPSGPPVYQEGGTTRSVIVYQLTATATSGTFATSSYIERQVTATVSKCRALDGSVPGYDCP